MRLNSIFILLFLMVLCAANAMGQATTSAGEKADQLRLQLLDVQAKESALRTRLQQLDEEMKPENIERALAGIGSTRPEELREHRRRMLAIEKDSLTAQLRVLESSQARLEAAIAEADIRAYQQSAQPSTDISNKMLMTRFPIGMWVVAIGVGTLAVVGIAILLFLKKRRVEL